MVYFKPKREKQKAKVKPIILGSVETNGTKLQNTFIVKCYIKPDGNHYIILIWGVTLFGQNTPFPFRTVQLEQLN